MPTLHAIMFTGRLTNTNGILGMKIRILKGNAYKGLDNFDFSQVFEAEIVSNSSGIWARVSGLDMVNAGAAFYFGSVDHWSFTEDEFVIVNEECTCVQDSMKPTSMVTLPSDGKYGKALHQIIARMISPTFKDGIVPPFYKKFFDELGGEF